MKNKKINHNTDDQQSVKSTDLRIIFPETLVNIWKYTHNENLPEFSNEQCGKVWQKLENILAGKFKNNIPGIKNYQKAQEAARDFLVDFFQAACPAHINSMSALIANAKKYLARKNNPIQYELNEILHEAILDLEKQQLIERDERSRGHKISSNTWVALTGTSVACQASMIDYERNKQNVENFTTKLRNGSAEHSRILTPADAKALVLQLLKAFGGWTKKTDLFTAMQNHIPEQMKIVDIQARNEDEEVSLENIVAVEDDYMDEFDAMQINRIAGIAAERIWKRICEVSNKVFCLYYLPKTFSKCDVKLGDIGATSTVSDQNRRISNIVQDEMKSYLDANDGDKSQAVRRTVRKILRSLCGSCTESGYNPGLYSREI